MAALGAPVDFDPFSGSGGGDSYSATVSPERKATRQELQDYLVKQKGLSPAGAVGMLDNAYINESGGDPTAVGDGGTSFGLFQDHKERAANLGKYAQDRGILASDPYVQLDFAVDEELKKQYPDLFKTLQTTKDETLAHDLFRKEFERPASSGLGPGSVSFSDYALSEPGRRRNTDLLEMSPSDYLSLSPPLERPWTDKSGQSLLASLKAGDKVEQVPSLTVGKDGEVTDQDGRHRALAAQDAGLATIPVAVQRSGSAPLPAALTGMQGMSLPTPKPVSQEQGGLMRFLIPSAEAATLAAPQPGLQPQTPAPQASANAPSAQAQQSHIMGRQASEATLGPPVDFNPFEHKASLGPATSFNPNAVDMATPTVQPPPLPLQDDPNKTYGNVLPFAVDKTTGQREWAVPEILRAPIRGMVAGGQQAFGQRPVNDPSTRGDLFSAASLGAGASPVPAVRSVTEAATSVFRPMYDFVARILGKDIEKNKAALQVVAKLEKSQKAGGPGAQDMLDIVNSAKDKPLTLADLGDENILALAGKVARAPGESRQIMADFLNKRDMEAPPRLVEDVNKGIGKGSAYDAAAALKDVRARAAAPKYEAAFSRIQVTPEEAASVARFVRDPIGQEALQRGMRVIQLEKLAAGEDFDPALYGVARAQDGRFSLIGDFRNLRLMDAVKRGYDEIVEGFRDPTSGRLNLNQYGRAVNDVRAAYVGQLRNMYQRYAAALDAWSGPSQTLDALKAGQGFLRQRPEEVARRLSTLGTNDREFFKLGAADTLRIALAKKGPEADEAKAIIRNQFTRDLLRPLFDTPEAYDKFIGAVEAEGRMFGTRYNVLKGSQTAARMAEDTSPTMETAQHLGHGVLNAARGAPIEMVGNALRAASSMLRRDDSQLNAEIARILTTPLTGQTGGRMNFLQEMMMRLPATRNALTKTQYAGPGSRAIAPGVIVQSNALNGQQ